MRRALGGLSSSHQPAGNGEVGGSDRAGEGVSLPDKGRRQQGESLCGKEAWGPLLHGDNRQVMAFLPPVTTAPRPTQFSSDIHPFWFP